MDEERLNRVDTLMIMRDIVRMDIHYELNVKILVI